MSEDNTPRLTMDDVAPLFCASGIVQWCKHHGFEPREIIRGPGLDLEKVEALNDAYGNQAAARARKRIGGDHE